MAAIRLGISYSASKRSSDVNYGVVGRAYVLKILQELAEDRRELATWLEARRGLFHSDGA